MILKITRRGFSNRHWARLYLAALRWATPSRSSSRVDGGPCTPIILSTRRPLLSSQAAKCRVVAGSLLGSGLVQTLHKICFSRGDVLIIPTASIVFAFQIVTSLRRVIDLYWAAGLPAEEITFAISARKRPGGLPPNTPGALVFTCTATAIFLSGKYIMSVT